MAEKKTANPTIFASRIDREARDFLAQLLEKMLRGGLTNVQYAGEYESYMNSRRSLAPPGVSDVAISEIIVQVWFFDTDLDESVIELSHDERKAVERAVLFLKTDLPYEWPEQRFGVLVALRNLAHYAYQFLLHCFGGGSNTEADDGAEYWPFRTPETYESVARGDLDRAKELQV